MKNDKQSFNRHSYNVMDANKSFFYVIVANIISPIVFLMIAYLIFAFEKVGVSGGVTTFIHNLFAVIIIPLLFLTIIILMHNKNKINAVDALNIKGNYNVWNFVIIVLLLAITIVCFFPLVNMIYALLSNAGLNVSGQVAFQMDNWWTYLIAIVPYCLLPAVAEEIIFRGMMLKGTLSKAKPVVAITISALAFFLMHGSIIQSIYQILLGFLLSIIGYYMSNIIYPIIFHFLNNWVVISLAYFNIGGFIGGFSISWGGFGIAIALAVAGAGAIIGLIYLIRHINKNVANENNSFVVKGDNIIIENNNNLTFKQLLKSFTIDEQFYFYSAWVIAIIIWLMNSL